VTWIAHNDESSELNDVQAVAQQISVALVADLFDVHEIDVANAVLALRHWRKQ
jgi:hypothetical protein